MRMTSVPTADRMFSSPSTEKLGFKYIISNLELVALMVEEAGLVVAVLGGVMEVGPVVGDVRGVAEVRAAM